jgi:hypothetical protein
MPKGQQLYTVVAKVSQKTATTDTDTSKETEHTVMMIRRKKTIFPPTRAHKYATIVSDQERGRKTRARGIERTAARLKRETKEEKEEQREGGK